MRFLLNIFLIIFFSKLFSQNTITYQCILRSNAQKDTMCDGKVMPVYGITNSLGATAKIPAKILYCNEGDSVVLDTKSISQKEHHTIHLHGLDVDTRNDGDPATSFWLKHMQDTTYSFRAKNAGTYLYHCHVSDVVHVQMGMYGLIVVKAAGGVKTVWTGGPAYDKDYKWLMSEVDSVWHYHVPVHDTIMDTLHIPKYVPNYFLINGQCGNEITNNDSIKINGSQNEKILIRLANIGFLTNKVIFPSWLNAQILDSDGRPLPNAIINDTCFMMPGERYSILISSNTQTTGNILVSYVDMNTGADVFTNPIPVNISGVFSVKEQNRNEHLFSLFPNPASNILHISSIEEVLNLNIEIINSMGQIILKQKYSEQIDISELSKGIYILKFNSASNYKFSKVFIKN